MKKSIIIIIATILATMGFQVLANKSEANAKETLKVWCQANYWYADNAPEACEEFVPHSAIRFSETRHALMHYPNISLYAQYLDAQAKNNTVRVIEIEKKVQSDLNQSTKH